MGRATYDESLTFFTEMLHKKIGSISLNEIDNHYHLMSAMFFYPFLIMLREGLEATLIVVLIACYLKKRGSHNGSSSSGLL